MIAGWHQKHGNGAGHDDRVQYGFVAVAVNDYDVAWRNCRVPDDLVGC